MLLKRSVQAIILFVVSISFSSAYLITGGVDDSYSGELAAGKTIYLWRTGNMADNLTDIISGTGTYDFDCELLHTPCVEGDNLSLQVINGPDKLSALYTFNVTGGSYFLDFRLNSRPYLNLLFPEDGGFAGREFTFDCFYNDSDGDVLNVSLYSDIGGSLVKVVSIVGTSGHLTYSVEDANDGSYSYYCEAQDQIILVQSQTYDFEVDSVPPTITSFSSNVSSSCGNGFARISCEADDEHMRDVRFEVYSQGKFYNLSGMYDGQKYYYNFYMNESGEYSLPDRTDKLFQWVTFDLFNSTSVLDNSSFQKHFDYSAGADSSAMSVNGRFGIRALNLTKLGTGYLDASNFPTGENMTVAFWLKVGSAPSSQARVLMSSTGYPYIGIESSGRMKIAYSGSEYVLTKIITDGNWHHFVINLAESGQSETDVWIDSFDGYYSEGIDLSNQEFSSNWYVGYDPIASEAYLDELFVFEGRLSPNEIFVKENTHYTARCIARDLAGNLGISNPVSIIKRPSLPDLVVNDVTFGGKSVENSAASVSINVENHGCVSAGSFNISFYKESISPDNLLERKQMFLSADDSDSAEFNFTALIGRTAYFFVADAEGIREESREGNNENSDNFTISSWQTFRGSIEAMRRLADAGGYNLSSWGIDSFFIGNVFITDVEADISWRDLIAIGKDKNGLDSSDDFAEIDEILDSRGYEDSVAVRYSSPTYKNYSFNRMTVYDVPCAVSQSGQPFYTGVLWDSSDSTDDEFDIDEKEDIVFISKIEQGITCGSGTCDYEIEIPAKLREFYTSHDSERIYLYYDLE